MEYAHLSHKGITYLFSPTTTVFNKVEGICEKFFAIIAMDID